MQKEFLYRGRPYRFKDIVVAYRKALDKLPVLTGTEAVNFFKTSFRVQAWVDSYRRPWAPRKNKKKGDSNRAILIGKGSGRLRNSIKIITATPKYTAVGTNVPYAAAHNDGFRGRVQVRKHVRRQTARHKTSYESKSGRTVNRTVRKHTGTVSDVRSHTRFMNLKQRQFMGNSADLDKKMERLIQLEIQKIFI